MMDNVEMAIHKPDGATQLAWTQASTLSANLRTIDTSIEGKWVVSYRTHDEAKMFGWQEASNVAHQKVYITISDNRKPTLYVQTYNGDKNTYYNGNNKSPVIECASSGKSYSDPSPGALSKDLRESWTAAGWNFQKIRANEAWSTVVVSSLDGKACTNTNAAKKACHRNADVKNNKKCCFQSYTLSYSNSDGSQLDNKAVDVYRTVRVVDTTKPVIVLKDHEGSDESGDGKITNSAGYNNKYGGFEKSGKGCKFGDAACLSHGKDGTTMLKTGKALEDHCAAGDCHDGGFFDYHALTVGKEGQFVSWIAGAKAGVGGDDEKQWRGARCTDTCDTKPTLIATLHEGKGCTGKLVGDGQIKAFPEYRKGDYSILYTCTDGNQGDTREARLDKVCRDIENVDHTRPVIQILGANKMTLEATHEGNYVDDGATCYDQVDGVISQNVEVSGDVVDLSKVGEYEIVYHCRDSAGNTAPVEKRIVVIKQTTCPTCKMTNCEQHKCTMKHEASFQYTDAGATCTDPVDGSLTNSIEVTNPVDVEKTGTYVVTYRVKNTVGRYNDLKGCRDGAQEYMRTVVVEDTLKPVIEIRYKNKLVARSAAKDKAVHNSAENPMGTTVCKASAADNCGALNGAALQTYCVKYPSDCHDAGWQ